MIFSRISEWWSSGDLDDQFLESYRKVLFGQYHSLTKPVENPAAREEAESVIKLEPKDVDWDDLYRLELAIIKLESPDNLRRRAWVLRNEYKEMASPDEYKDYLASQPPKADAASDPEELRADLARLQEELNWRYIVVWMLEAYRSQILFRLVRRTLVIVAVSVIITYIASVVAYVGSWTDLNLPVLVAVIVPGIVGGLISTARRIQDAHFGNNADQDLSQLEQGNTSIYLSPFLGGIFAFLLFFLFAGGFLVGNLFPKVDMDSLLISGLDHLDYKEMAKVIIWSFIAGFAEKFVPDRLDKFAQNGAATAKSNGARKNAHAA
jgi:hypothetical protein